MTGLLILAFQGPASSAPSLSGSHAFVIFDCAKDTILLRFKSAIKPLAVRTENIRAAGTSLQSVAWNVAWRLPIPTEPGINEYEAVGTIGNRCPSLGKYGVTVKIFSDADGSGDSLDFSVERQTDASLYVAPAMTVQASKYVPFGDSLRPSADLLVREESQSNPIAALTVMPGELKSANGEFVGVRIGPADPRPIFLGAGSDLEIPLRLSSGPPAGIYSARLVLRSPELAVPATVEMSLKIRIGLGYLLLVLACGVSIGWFVNIRLATAASVDQAMIDLLRAADGLAARAHSQRDPAVQQRLVGLAGELESHGRLCQTTAELQELMKTFQATVGDIETTAAATLKALQQDLATTRSEFAANTAPLDPLIAKCLRLDLDSLARIERLSEAGDVEEATRQLQAYRRGLPASVRPSLQAWLASIKTSLLLLGKWDPATQDPEKVLALLRDSILPAYSVQDFTAMIQQSNSLAAQLRGYIALTLPAAVAGVFRAAAGALRSGERSELAASVEAVASNVFGVPTEDPVAAVTSIAASRQRVHHLLLAASPSAKVTAVTAHLEDGDFIGAAELIAPQTMSLQSLQPAAAVAPGTRPAASGVPLRETLTLPPDDNRAVPLRLRLPSDMLLNQSVTVFLDWSGTPPKIAIAWTCDPREWATVAGDSQNTATFVAKKPGFCTLRATVPGYGEVSAKTYIGSVRQTPDFLALEKRQWRVKRITWVVTAVLTTGVGFQIFAASWLGTPADFVSAFLWGFFGQYGLERVRDLARPVTSRAMS